MRRNDIQRDAASLAVIALRAALGKTQQRFSEIARNTLGTVAAWETSRPPKGDALLKLAAIAWENNQGALSQEFEVLYLDEIVPRLRMKGIDRTKGRSGYVLLRYDGPEDLPWAEEYLRQRAESLAEYQAELATAARKRRRK